MLFFTIHGQSKIDYPIYFAYKIAEMDTTEEKRLGFFLKNFDSFSIDSIAIKGYCDDRGKKKINDTLSKKRAENILDFTQSKIKYKLPFHIQGEGSIGLGGDLKIDSQRTLNRRAELELFYSMTKRKDTAKLKTKPVIKEAQTVPQIEITDFLKSAKKGENIDLKIFFMGNSSEATKSSTIELVKLVEILKENTKRRIKITGHIFRSDLEENEDGYDIKEKNRFLSTNRAKTVYNYLIENGIDKDRLSYEGMGSRFPNKKEHGNDRRVEIEVIE
jgi:outer membrane protein OmpA-like peptidoglycan-associated protein